MYYPDKRQHEDNYGKPRVLQAVHQHVVAAVGSQIEEEE